MISSIFVVLAPVAIAAPSGTEISTDPEGDNPPDGPDTDILRLGASADGTAASGFVHLFLTVKDISAQDKENGYQVQWKGPNAQPTFNVIVQYAPDGTFTTATMSKDTDPLATAVPVTASWILNDGLGDTIKIDVRRADLAATGNANAAWTAIIGETFPIDESPVSGINVDQTNTPGTWTLVASVAAPDAVAGVVAQAHASHIVLSWPAPYNGGASISSYKIYDDATLVGTSPTASFDHTGLTTGSTHSYQVSAVNSAGEGLKSAALAVTAVDPTVATAVQNLVAQAGDASVTLAWQAPATNGGATITNYRVYKNDVAMPNIGPVLTTTVTGLTNGQLYSFKVAAINSAGEGALGSAVSATPSNAMVPIAFEEFLGPGNGAGEPSIGMNQVTGEVYYTDGFLAYRVSNLVANDAPGAKGSATWTDTEWPQQFPHALADPIGFTDRQTGRWFEAQIFTPPNCSDMSFTDDGGRTWTNSLGACGSGNGFDHQTIGGGPWTAGTTIGSTGDYPNSVYYCAQMSEGATCAISQDGGVVFGPSNIIYYTILKPGDTPVSSAAPEGFCSNLHGHVKVAPDGVVAVPTSNCYKSNEPTTTKGGVYSLDDGQKWHLFSIPGSTQWNGDFDPSISWSVDKAPGKTYHRMWYSYTDGDRKMKATYSDNLGATWAPSIDVGAPLGLINTQFAQMVAGDYDRAAVAFLGSTTGGDAQLTTYNGVYHAYVAMTYNSGATWQLVKASTDPVQKGCISAGGTTSTGCRNLLDFNDLQMDGKGKVGFAYADGCTSAACKTETPATNAVAGSTNDAPAFAYQMAGRGLLVAFDNGVTVPEAPGLEAAASTGKVHLSWTVPADGNSPLTGYDVYRDDVLLVSVGPAVQNYDDFAVVDGTTYSYRVAAKNVIGTGAQSAAVAATPQVDLEAPTQVTNLLATSSEGAVSLSWNPATDNAGVANYIIKAAGISDITVTGAQLSAAITGLQNGRPYAFTVEAVDGSGNHGPASDATTARPVRVATARFLAADPAGDSTGIGATDLRAFAFLTDADNVRFEWTVDNLATSPGANKEIYYAATIAINGLSYAIEYDSPGSRCHAYHDAAGFGVVGTVGTCANDAANNKLTARFARSAFEAQWLDGDSFAITDISTGTITLNPQTGASTGSVSNDAIGPQTYAAGSPPRAQPPAFDAIGAQTGDEGSLLAFTVHATSPEGDFVTYTVTGATGATVDALTGEFAWTPTYAQAGAYTATFTADTGAATSTKDVSITIADVHVNSAPVLAAIGDKAASEASLLSFTISATDIDNDPITYSLTGAPSGATIDPSTGEFSWTPTYADSGPHSVTLVASDGSATASETISIVVANVNRAPVLDAIGSKTTVVGSPIDFGVTATDADGDAVTIAATGLPAGATFDGAMFTWTPAAGDAGAHSVTFEASDGAATAQEVVEITVSTVNHAPTIDTIADQFGAENALLTFTVAGADEDGSTLTYSATDLPAGAAIDSATGIVTWTPTYSQAGTYAVEFTVSDGQLSATTPANIEIANVDQAPVIGAVANPTLVELATLNVAIPATDADGDAIVLSLDGAAPAWATVSGTTLTLAPPVGAKGTHALTVTATANGLTATRDLIVTVLQKSAFTLVVQGSNIGNAAPNGDVTLTATIKNTGPSEDTFSFTSKSSVLAWTVTTPGPVTLLPGASTTVTVTATAPATGTQTTVTLTGASDGNPTVKKVITWTAKIPVIVTVTMTKASFGITEDVTGIVHAKYLDNSPAVHARVTVKQTPPTVGTLTTQVADYSDADGNYAFVFTSSDLQAHVLGTHPVSVTVIGTQTVLASSSYIIAAS